jgi:hypothetical protein
MMIALQTKLVRVMQIPIQVGCVELLVAVGIVIL